MSIIYTAGMTLDELEKEVILYALKFYQGNKTHTSNSLGIAYRTLDDKLKKYEDKSEEIKKITDERKALRAKLLQTQRGIRMEQINESSKEQPVPMQERQEVQEMPSKQNATSGSNKRNSEKNVR